MARARTKPKLVASGAAKSASQKPSAKGGGQSHHNGWSEMFSHMACTIAHWAGKPVAFLTATSLVIIWAATGPVFGFSDTWQLVINTSTTIITFLMVFLIQNTQNRDTMALQVKLSELILVMSEAENKFATAEDLSEEELEVLHQELHKRAETTLGVLNTRRAATS